MVEDPHVLTPGTAPTPFTADEIRGASRPDRTLRSLVEGETSTYRVTRYVACDDVGATLERSVLSLDGAPLGEPEVDRVTWLELQGHASFPADDTTIEPERIETALGTLDCLRYTVRREAGEDVFWFATDLPGMPVLRVSRTAGRVVTTVSVVAITTP
jgi:hypothetical protein